MNDVNQSPAEQNALAQITGPAPPARTGNWKPVLTLLVLAPAIGELLSGSSPPLQFFNPVFFLLLVGLYGCGALLVRETVARRQLNAAAVLLLGAAYGIIEEGLTCKSFFNLHWTDTGFLSVYGRGWGVNWVRTFGLTVYHTVVSITVPASLSNAVLIPSIAEIEPAFELVSPRKRDLAFMLQAPGDNAGGDAGLAGEPPNRCQAEIAVAAELLVVTRRNQAFLREGVRLSLPRIPRRALTFTLLYEHGAFAMLHDMPGLVIEREPKVIVGLASRTQLNKRFGTMQPAGDAVGAHSREWGNENHSYTRLPTVLAENRDELGWVLQRKAP